MSINGSVQSKIVATDSSRMTVLVHIPTEYIIDSINRLGIKHGNLVRNATLAQFCQSLNYLKIVE